MSAVGCKIIISVRLSSGKQVVLEDHSSAHQGPVAVQLSVAVLECAEVMT